MATSVSKSNALISLCAVKNDDEGRWAEGIAFICFWLRKWPLGCSKRESRSLLTKNGALRPRGVLFAAKIL